MIAFKKQYFFIIESTKDINLRNIKKYNKFVIIYRNNKSPEQIEVLKRFRNHCRLKLIKFFVANDKSLAIDLKADGLYTSAFNNSLRLLSLQKDSFTIIGSAHNLKEIYFKNKQRCNTIFFSKLYPVDYDKNAKTLGLIKFNNFLQLSKNIIPLGGIKIKNLNSLKNIRCHGFALFSEVKKKPANIINRLF